MAKVESLYGTTPAEIFQSGLERNEQIGQSRARMGGIGHQPAADQPVAAIGADVVLVAERGDGHVLHPV